jgi:hypothetical protein
MFRIPILVLSTYWFHNTRKMVYTQSHNGLDASEPICQPLFFLISPALALKSGAEIVFWRRVLAELRKGSNALKCRDRVAKIGQYTDNGCISIANGRSEHGVLSV